MASTQWSPKLSLFLSVPRNVLVTLGQDHLPFILGQVLPLEMPVDSGTSDHKTRPNVRAKPHHAQVLLSSCDGWETEAVNIQ